MKRRPRPKRATFAQIEMARMRKRRLDEALEGMARKATLQLLSQKAATARAETASLQRMLNSKVFWRIADSLREKVERQLADKLSQDMIRHATQATARLQAKIQTHTDYDARGAVVSVEMRVPEIKVAIANLVSFCEIDEEKMG